MAILDSVVEVLGGLASRAPARAAVEAWWLVFTPVWMGLVGSLMISGVVERWGDVPCMTLGVGLGAGALVTPVVWPHASERATPWWDRTAFKCGLAVFLLALGTNYTQAPFFFDVLHMHYGFQTTWNIDRTPIFLHFLSCAYFSTYFALCAMTFRWLRSTSLPSVLAWVVAPLAMAFLETALNANPFIETLFCYDDLFFVLWFGTLAYGMVFMLALPGWMAIDEVPGRRATWWNVGAWTLAALYLDLVALDVVRYHVAPALTEVVPDAPGLRDVETSCLEPIRG